MSDKIDKDTGFANTLRDVGPYLGLGLQLAVTIVVMVFIGDWLDSKLGLHYIFTLVFGFLGIGAGLYNLIKTVNDLERKNKDKK